MSWEWLAMIAGVMALLVLGRHFGLLGMTGGS
jgi:hypothetical protein